MESTVKLTNDRVRENTSRKALEKIDRITEENIHRYGSQDRAAIRERIEALNKEWDTERVLEVTSGINVLLGLALGLTVNRRWLILSAVSASFLVQHTLQGWCPPLPVIRSLGVRTKNEIEQERDALMEMLEDK
ncbi:MAG TPA: hypothetical protein VGE66_03015 [Chitinophagaceae bacterium]